MALSARARLEAPAKVNLHLRVLHRRPDGFHELRTVFQAVSLTDRVEVILHGSVRSAGVAGPPGGAGPHAGVGATADVVEALPGIRLSVAGEEGGSPPELGPPADNLAVRAAAAFQAEAGLEEMMTIRLLKRIPTGAGLGGGSSDAAAVLRALVALTEARDGGGLPPEELARLAAGLGSDVPFFVGSSPLAAATGRGERLRPLPPLPETELTLVLPPVHVSTGPAYAALERPVVSDSRDQASLPSSEGGGGALRPRSWAEVARHARNDFQGPVAARHPEVARALVALEDAGGRPVLLSWSGAACLAGGLDPEARRRLRDRLGWRVMAIRTRTRMPEVDLDDGGRA